MVDMTVPIKSTSKYTDDLDWRWIMTVMHLMRNPKAYELLEDDTLIVNRNGQMYRTFRNAKSGSLDSPE